ncbi:MAG: hypothetical protein FWE67_15890 [Planctomycetaceae bacterium]|nr:hypothetical protein [Planctomycetaceae bacterium]
MAFSAHFRFVTAAIFAAVLIIFITGLSVSAQDAPKKEPEAPAAKPADKPADKPAEKPSTTPAAKPEVKPAVTTTTKPAATATPTVAAPAAAAPAAPAPPKPAEPEIVELKKEPLRIFARGIGTFEPRQAEQILLKSEEFTTFEVVEVAAHGAKVKQGDVLIKFDVKKYEEQLCKRKRALLTSEIALKQSEIEFKYLERKEPLKLESFEREKKYADEDFLHFLNVEEEWARRMLAHRLKQTQYYVDSAKEELKQLEKMYKADDLIEETEEFILKRSKYFLAERELFHELEKMRNDRTKNVMLPRDDVAERHNSKIRTINYEQSKETFGFVLQQAKIKLEEARETHVKLAESFEKFVKDKELLTLKSPCDGIVYYGEYNSKTAPGTWNNASTVAGSVKVGNSVANKTVLFTIVNPKPSLVRTTVTEKDIHWITVGTKGAIRPTAFPNERYDVAVVECNEVPSVGNAFSALLAVELPDDAKIYPNMTCSLELIVYDKKESILVPITALKKEETEDDNWNHSYLFVQGENKTVSKVKVKTGNPKGEKIEMLSGVSAGQKIFKKFEDGEKAQEKK